MQGIIRKEMSSEEQEVLEDWNACVIDREANQHLNFTILDDRPYALEF